MSTVTSSVLPSSRKALIYWNTFRVKSLGAIRIAEDVQVFSRLRLTIFHQKPKAYSFRLLGVKEYTFKVKNIL